MNCLRLLELGSKVRISLQAFCVIALRLRCPVYRQRPCGGFMPPYKESYRLCIRLGNWKQGQSRTKGFVGASHGNLPHVKNFGDQVTLMQIGIQATARQTGFPWWRTIATMHELLRTVFTLGSASRQLRRRRRSVQSVSCQDASDRIARTFQQCSSRVHAVRSVSRNVTSDRSRSAKT
jgi:hypothetical protein